MWKCVNDHPWGYCTTEPDWEKESEVITGERSSEARIGGTCKLDPKTCGFHETNTEHSTKLNIDELLPPVAKVESIKEEPVASKPKSKRAKALEQEISQGSMF